MATPSQIPSFPDFENSHPSILPIKRSFSGGRMRSNPQQVGEQQRGQPFSNLASLDPSFSNTPSFLPHTTSRPTTPLNLASNNKQYHDLLLRYSDEDISKGLVLASHPKLLSVLRTYSPVYIMDGLKYAHDGALDFLEAYKDFPLDEVLACKQAIMKCTRDRTSFASTDSTYGSRPSSTVRNSASPNTFTPILTPNSSFGSAPGSFIPPSHSSPQTHASPYYTSPSSTACSPWELTKAVQPQLFACMYCNKGFAKPGNCLNHEKDQHSQKRNWKCGHPSCTAAFSTKRGYDDHHKNHRCLNCSYEVRVEELSKPKTACACPYCGLLFEGHTSFASRSDHIDEKHYRGEDRKTKADLDYSSMISSLLKRKDIKDAWESFLSGSRGTRLSWTPESAKSLLEELEFGVFRDDIISFLQRLYELADKITTCGYASLNDVNEPSQPLIPCKDFSPDAHNDLSEGISQSTSMNIVPEASKNQGSNYIHSPDGTELICDDVGKALLDPSRVLPNSQPDQAPHYDTVMFQECSDTTTCGSSIVPLADRPDSPVLPSHPLHLLQDVFMGSGDEHGAKIYATHAKPPSVSSPTTSSQILQARARSSFVSMRDLEKEDTLPSLSLNLPSNIISHSLPRGFTSKTYHGAIIASVSPVKPPTVALPWPPSSHSIKPEQHCKRC
ncbi:hypothetical protein AOQ84DRAFT_143000 [Glonium stellatum]|uniref:C2H2-type domain-containing protein n=1 Tax=Glonium stellatum TaxID=574774 RepID=A0A8E2F8S6_9PEZI|nr:hypothetical protein AOQ84DRAFT_143000 [Glonium stellatum]